MKLTPGTAQAPTQLRSLESAAIAQKKTQAGARQSISVRRNVIANCLGQGWTSIMGLLFVPLYIRYLGIEAYGLVGLFALIQAWLVLLDMGMTPTLNREMARFTAGAHSPQSIRNLLHSLEVICFSLGALIAVGIWCAADYLARDWLNAKQLPVDVVASAVTITALVVALRFCSGIYSASLVGLQRQVWYNTANAILGTLRHGGALAVLMWVSPSVKAFFVWQAVVSVITMVLYAAEVHQSLPKATSTVRFSRGALAGVWKFASGMIGITILSLVLSQIDKVLLSRLLPLEDFGYYALASSVAGSVYLIVSPIIQALSPRMVQLSTREDKAELIGVYHRESQLVSCLTAPVCIVTAFFAEGIVFMWSGDPELAKGTSSILSILVLANFFNAMIWMPYQCQLAHSWTSLTLKANIVMAIILVPAILLLVPRFGAKGAASIWLLLNVGQFLFSIPFMHIRLMPLEKWRWYFADVLLPTSGAIGVVLIARELQPIACYSRIHWLAFLSTTATACLVASTILAGEVRYRVLLVITSIVRQRPFVREVE